MSANAEELPDDADQEADQEADAPDAEKPDVPEEAQADVGSLDLDLDGDSLAPDDGEDTDTAEDTSDGESVEAGEWGDMYVSVLTQTTNAIIDKHGDGEDIDESHFRQIDLDRHFNATLEKFSDGSEMEPERALVVGSLIGVAGPVAIHTDLMQEAASEIRERGDGVTQ